MMQSKRGATSMDATKTTKRMKSTEEKAKRYDEAIKRVENIKTGKCENTFMFTEGLFEYVFPELKESDDERMKNAAIRACKYMIDNFENSTKDYEDAIAWLEKQGKNNMGISEATKQKLDDNLNKALEKETPESWNEFLDEQNPAWSEEDEELLNTIINHFKVNVECTDDDDIIKWLKSLKDRVQPQSHWKPSEEQMQALKDALNDAIMQYDFKGSPIKEEVTRKHAETIESLYNDLKKLREE